MSLALSFALILPSLSSTNIEPAQWLGMGLTSVWEQFFAAMVKHENLSAWQDKVQNAAPPGWTLELVSMSLGKAGPTLSNWQCFSSAEGRLVASECQMELISDSVRVIVRGTGPLGAFQATVSSLSVSGHMKLIPMPDQRMILWSFKEPPNVSFKLQLSSGLSSAYDVPSFGFLRSALTDSIKGSLVEPRRAAISLDYEHLVQLAIDTTVTVFVESVQSIFPSSRRAATSTSSYSQEDEPIWESTDDDAPADPMDKTKRTVQTQAKQRSIQIIATNVETKLKRRTSVKPVTGGKSPSSIGSVLNLSLGGKDGIIKIDVLDCSKDSRPILGSCLVHTAATKDGKTLFWAVGKDGDPLALRWQPSLGPWRLTLPLEGSASPRSSITLQLSTDPWIYKPSPLVSNGASEALIGRPLKTPGPRSIIVQILEARDLSPRSWGASTTPSCDPYAIIKYNNRTLRTPTLYNTTIPVWNRSFVLAENTSQSTKRIRLELWDSGVSRDESLGSAALNLDLALENTIQDRWIQLVGEESGEVRVRITAVPGEPSSPTVQSTLSLFETTLSRSSTPLLRVVVLMARNLPPREDKAGSGKVANVIFNGTRQASFVRPSSSPTFNFSSFFPFEGPEASASASPSSLKAKAKDERLRIELKVSDSLLPDGKEEIGHCSLDVRSLIPTIGMSWEEWVPLKREGGPHGAEVLIRVSHLEPSPLTGLSGLPIPSTSTTYPSARSSLDLSASDEKPEGTALIDDVGDLDEIKRLSPGDLIASGAVQLFQGLGRQLEVTREAGSELRDNLGKEWSPKIGEWWKSTTAPKKPKEEGKAPALKGKEEEEEEEKQLDLTNEESEIKVTDQVKQPASKSSLFGFSFGWPAWGSTLPTVPSAPVLPQNLTFPLELLSAEQISKIKEQVPDLLSDVIKGGQSMTGLAKLDLSSLSQSSRSFVLSILPLSVLNYQEGKIEGVKEQLALASHALDLEEGEDEEEEVVISTEAAATIDVEEIKEPAVGVKAELEISLDWGNALSSFEEIFPEKRQR